jgi:3-methyladenine DNA glycosylase AlkD
MNSAAAVLQEIRSHADERRAVASMRYFRTAQGEYGHGDVFAGVSVPTLRAIEKRHRDRMRLEDALTLLHQGLHEARLLAAISLCHHYRRADNAKKKRIFEMYLENTQWINNWDIVDLSAPHVVGAHLFGRAKGILFQLARSSWLWDRRIAVVSTLHFIRHYHLDTTFDLCSQLLGDSHDLIHKACGWMLREAGKRDPEQLLAFLGNTRQICPRWSCATRWKNFLLPCGLPFCRKKIK